jgi:hypothetical protein
MHLLRAGIMGTAIMGITMATIMGIITTMDTTTGIGITGATGTAAIHRTTRLEWSTGSIPCIAPMAITRMHIRRQACLSAGGISALGLVGFSLR